MSTRADIYAVLNVPEMTDVATGGVHFSLVTDQELEPPFCIFHLETGVDQWAMGTSALENDVWVVKGAGPRGDVTEEIDEIAQSLMADAIGVFCRRIGPIEYSEPARGTVTYYRGSRYRIRKDRP